MNTNNQRILADLTANHEQANNPAMADLLAKIATLEAALKAQSAPKALTLKVSEKGALSIYGLGRFPVTLYAGQWERLIAAADQIKAFMTANASLLATKD